MPEALITPTFEPVDSFLTGTYKNGGQIEQWHVSEFAIANGAIAIGDVVVDVVPTATQSPRVAKSGVAPTGWTTAGVARTAATAAGQTIEVVYGGFTLVNVGAGSPVAGDVCINTNGTAGQAGIIAAGTGVVAATVGGTVMGNYMGIKDANNLALVKLRRF